MTHLRDVSAPPPTAEPEGQRTRAGAAAVLGVLLLGALLLNAGLLLTRSEREPAGPAPSARAERGALACTVFAGPAGDDAAPGTQQQPLRTADRLVESLRAGQTGCLLAGTYDVDEHLAVEEDDVTLRSAPGQRATLVLDTLFIPAGADDVTISDLNIVGGDDDVTIRAIGDRFALRRNDITNRHQGRSCILVGSQESSASGGSIIGNAIHHCGRLGGTLDHAVYAQHFSPDREGDIGLLVAHNALFAHAAYAVQLYPEGRGAVVRDNVIDGEAATRGGIVIDGELAEDHAVERNVITRSRTSAVEQRTGSGHVARGNCFVDNADDVDADQVEATGNITSRDKRYDVCLRVLKEPWRRVGDLTVGTPLLPW